MIAYCYLQTSKKYEEGIYYTGKIHQRCDIWNLRSNGATQRNPSRHRQAKSPEIDPSHMMKQDDDIEGQEHMSAKGTNSYLDLTHRQKTAVQEVENAKQEKAKVEDKLHETLVQLLKEKDNKCQEPHETYPYQAQSNRKAEGIGKTRQEDDEKLQRMKIDYEALKKNNTELEGKTKERDSKIKELENKIKELAKRELAHESDIARVQRECDDSIQKLQAEHEMKIDTMKREYEKRQREQGKKTPIAHHDDIEKNREHEENMQKLKSHEEETKKKEKEHEQEIQKVQSKYDADITALKEECKRLKEVKKELEEEIQKYDAEITAAKEENEKMNKELEDKMKKYKDDYRVEIDKVKAEHEKKVSEMTEFEEKMRDLEEKNDIADGNVKKLRREYEEKIEKLRRENEDKIEKLRQEYEDKIEKVRRENEDKIEKLRQEYEGTRKQREEKEKKEEKEKTSNEWIVPADIYNDDRVTGILEQVKNFAIVLDFVHM